MRLLKAPICEKTGACSEMTPQLSAERLKKEYSINSGNDLDSVIIPHREINLHEKMQ